MKTYKKVLFLFHRDLRLHDNTGLIAACRESEEVIPIFIFTPEQIEAKNRYKSDNAVQFMLESLTDLDKQIEAKGGKLSLFYGSTDEIIENIAKNSQIQAVYTNADYTPFARKRDKQLATFCKKLDIHVRFFDDTLLNVPGTVLTGSGQPYKVFTPFWRAASKLPVAKDTRFAYSNFLNKPIKGELSKKELHGFLPKPNTNIALSGGRTEALKIIKNCASYKDYLKTRDIPALQTTLLSAHLKFGTISVREAYHQFFDTLGHTAIDGLMKQLYWRDFWYHIAYFWPEVFGHAFQEQYEHIDWNNNSTLFHRWCEGNTGFPIVDAGMRQLNKTGFMHNRVRMIVASFLTKDLHIDWRKGEHYFATKLVDYDPCVNNGNWQWAASTGCDAQPYFRIFNPWTQQEKFDPECIYIKQWVPELAHVPAAIIHTLHKGVPKGIKYPATIVDHATEAKKAIALYKHAATKST